jgi:site-specific DNA-methyltransferase (adenine-specific)
MTYQTYNQDCRLGLKTIADESVDLIFTDPPYGIKGAELDKHYNRDESKVVLGYIDIDKNDYAEFCVDWIKECSRILKPTGSMYIVSGYSNLHHILNALHATKMREINHIIAEYTFGVYTKNKWVSSHYHILYWGKSKKTYFNGQARFADTKDSYNDRLSVQKLTREYQPDTVKNKNQLPISFIEKFIEYSSQTGDLVLDPFAGSFSTGQAANKLQRNFIGFEQNIQAYQTFGHNLA